MICRSPLIRQMTRRPPITLARAGQVSDVRRMGLDAPGPARRCQHLSIQRMSKQRLDRRSEPNKPNPRGK